MGTGCGFWGMPFGFNGGMFFGCISVVLILKKSFLCQVVGGDGFWLH